LEGKRKKKEEGWERKRKRRGKKAKGELLKRGELKREASGVFKL